MYDKLRHKEEASTVIFGSGAADFEQRALAVFGFQAAYNPLYREYLSLIGCDPVAVRQLVAIPFLPISFFKTHRVATFEGPGDAVFESSGTTGTVNSKHYVSDLSFYVRSFIEGFQKFYGPPEEYVFLCLLPSYLERRNASLVYMADRFIQQSKYSESGFYLHDFEALAARLKKLKGSGKPVVLLGVSFALLDFAEAFPMDLSGTIVMETGGMKGRRAEWTRGELHQFLMQRWHLPAVHAEYGMTELLSQAYSQGEGVYHCSDTMRVLARDQQDPLTTSVYGSGCLNIIDLANLHSCAFIATEDLGRVHEDGSFEVLGRIDYSALRGCSLMYQP